MGPGTHTGRTDPVDAHERSRDDRPARKGTKMNEPLHDRDTETLRTMAVRGGIEGADRMEREDLLDALVARPGEGAWQEDPKPAAVNPNDFFYQAPR